MLIIAFSLFNIVIGTGVNIGAGTFDPVSQLLASIFDVILIAYFLTSRRAKAVLTEPFTAAVKEEELAREVSYYQPKTWAFWRNLIMYFCVFSVVGHWMEAAYCTLIRFGLLPGIYDPTSQIWSDWLYPFPVYGVGVVVCAVVVLPLKVRLVSKRRTVAGAGVQFFLITVFVCMMMELVMGFMLNRPDALGEYPLWDNSDLPLNVLGQAWLVNDVALAAAMLYTWVIYPLCQKALAKVPPAVMNVVAAVVVIGFVALCVTKFS